ncbi:hypothetical protein Anas_12639 [Armadillidium nasatum]|uniref:Uncharacterized protein n=1 Tax=Armadillidium nasatum TaxID=96803 RepID=A0A5N5T8M4_9CRUS|nr:hypothetical protein Anas_12639 [Armadillidium nasatum]
MEYQSQEAMKLLFYPKSNDYRNITRALLVKYPSLGNTFEPVVAEEIWKSKIIGHFQNNRHRNLKTLPIVQNRSLKKRGFAHPLKPPPNKRAAMHWLKNYLPERESASVVMGSG